MSLQKLNRITAHQKFESIDALLITKPENITYILGFKIESETSILIPGPEFNKAPSEVLVFLNALEYDRAKAEIEQNPELRKQIKPIRIPLKEPNFIAKTIQEFKITTLGFEDEFVNVKTYNEWRNLLEDIKLEGSSEVLMDARLRKTEQEIEYIKKAAEFGIIGFNTIYEECKAGMTEKELAARAEYAMRKAGSEGRSFDTIVASGKNSAYPHVTTSDKKVAKGDLIIVDIGATFHGYCSDMTRTFIFEGENANDFDKKAQLVNLVNDGQKKGLEEIRVGKRGTEMDDLVRNYFKGKHEEWGDRFIHSLGHGVGLEIHEGPYLSKRSDCILKSGMCVTIEPGLYIPGFGGARTEDLIVLTDEGYKNLTPAEKFYY